MFVTPLVTNDFFFLNDDIQYHISFQEYYYIENNHQYISRYSIYVWRHSLDEDALYKGAEGLRRGPPYTGCPRRVNGVRHTYYTYLHKS